MDIKNTKKCNMLGISYVISRAIDKAYMNIGRGGGGGGGNVVVSQQFVIIFYVFAKSSPFAYLSISLCLATVLQSMVLQSNCTKGGLNRSRPSP